MAGIGPRHVACISWLARHERRDAVVHRAFGLVAAEGRLGAPRFWLTALLRAQDLQAGLDRP